MIYANGVILFDATDAVNGYELWKSDGTSNGTTLVNNINLTGDAFNHDKLDDVFLNVNGIIYFTANDGVNGYELWKSDGTANSTSMVADINANGSSYPQNLTFVNNYIYFSANDGINGRELWRYDISSGILETIATGTWNANGTWNTNTPPTATKTAKINSTHTVSISNAGNQVKTIQMNGGVINLNGGLFAQNSITTPTGTPLTIGNNGVRLANLNSGSATTASNSKVLSVNATGDIILVPDVVGAGGGDPSFRIVNSNNTMGGTGSGNATTALGVANTFFGFNAGYSTGATAAGSQNAFFGANAGFYSTATCCNTFTGASAGVFNTLGASNTFLGQAAGANNRTGQFSTTGANNIWIGNFAGGNAGITNNNSCIFIGDQSGSWTGTNFASPTTVVNNLTNATSIGFQSQVTVSNALTLGGVGAYAVKVGIGEEGEFWVSNFKIRYQNENQWSDKVFEKDYKLMKINELDNFITQNKHLPNIPSAKEVVAKGIDNAEMTAKLLEKIEEMSLYIIQLEKRIKVLER
eukprot:gene25833-31199_t